MRSLSDTALRIVLNVRETSNVQSLQKENADLKEKMTDHVYMEVKFLQQTIKRFAKHCLSEVNYMLDDPPDTYVLMNHILWKSKCFDETYMVVYHEHESDEDEAWIYLSEEWYFNIDNDMVFNDCLTTHPGFSDSIMKVCFNGHREYKFNDPCEGSLCLVTDTFEGGPGSFWHNDNFSWS